MLSVSQIRPVQWERDCSELDDTDMVTLADTVLNSPEFWMNLKVGAVRSDTVFLDGSALLVLYGCLSVEDEILLQIVHVQ